MATCGNRIPEKAEHLSKVSRTGTHKTHEFIVGREQR